jgi:hypothetical protein
LRLETYIGSAENVFSRRRDIAATAFQQAKQHLSTYVNQNVGYMQQQTDKIVVVSNMAAPSRP